VVNGIPSPAPTSATSCQIDKIAEFDLLAITGVQFAVLGMNGRAMTPDVQATGASRGKRSYLLGKRSPAACSYGALGVGAALVVILGLVAIGRGGSPSTITVGKNPVAVAITPDGTTAYVVNMASNTVTPISVATGRVGRAIPVNNDIGTSPGGPTGIVIAPGGTTAYVVDPPTATLVPVKLARGTTGKPIPIPGGPVDVALSPNGATAYVVTGHNTVIAVKLAAGTRGKPIPVSANAAGIAIAPNGATAYVTSFTHTWTGQRWRDRDGKITPINLATGTVRKAIPVGGAPTDIAIAPDGATAYVVNTDDNDTVIPVNLVTGLPGKPIPDPDEPIAIAIAPNGATAYVTNFQDSHNGQDGTVTPINLASDQPGKPISVGGAPEAIAITPHGTAAYVVNFNDDTVTVIHLKR
jgi:YVTN family beta-propeller protein